VRLIFERSAPGRRGVALPRPDVPAAAPLDARWRRAAPAALPEVSELDVVRHYTRLSQENFSVDTNFYPLGSCTMKYNPKFTEAVAGLEGFRDLHPLLPQLEQGCLLTQGALEVIHSLEGLLCEITGMKAFTCQPMAGAHGELTGMMLVAAYHRAKGRRRTHVLVPDSSHGTNPSSAAIAGYETRTIPTDARGVMDLGKFREALNEETAAVMLTCPNTLGIFESQIAGIARLARERGALMYCDGANMNAVIGRVRPGDVGFDIVHLNLHKTLATPHGGGGPGAGPVGVNAKLEPFLPISRVIRRKDGSFFLDYDRPDTIGYIAPFYGNFGVLLRAYAYLLLLGREGLAKISDHAVLNANYLRVKLRDAYEFPFDRICMHECVASASRQAARGVQAIDIAKALIDRGFHPPTVYFPLIVKEAMMIEPTETESRETLDAFVAALREIAALAERDPDAVRRAPERTRICRPDETRAARNPKLRWTPGPI
jgi:glycine dehydrogenase subunit 2